MPEGPVRKARRQSRYRLGDAPRSAALGQAGWRRSRSVAGIEIQFPLMIDALKSGRVDAVEPLDVRRPDAWSRLQTLGDPLLAVLIRYCSIWIRRRRARANRGVLKKYVTSLEAGLRIIKSDVCRGARGAGQILRSAGGGDRTRSIPAFNFNIAPAQLDVWRQNDAHPGLPAWQSRHQQDRGDPGVTQRALRSRRKGPIAGRQLGLAANMNAIGQPLRRKEDFRLITGQGRFSDDFNLDGRLLPRSFARPTRTRAYPGWISTRRALCRACSAFSPAPLEVDGLRPIDHSPVPSTRYRRRANWAGRRAESSPAVIICCRPTRSPRR